MRALSHSSISLYQECPQKFKFRYVEGIKEAPKSYFSFGQSVHKTLEFLYSSQLIPPALPEVLTHYETNWVKEGYKSPQEENIKFAEGKKILIAFYAKHAKDWKPPMATEYDFSVSIDGIAVRGKIDRIDKLASGNLHVIDYKTGKPFQPKRADGDAQLTLYQMACEEALGLAVEKLTLYHLPTLEPQTSPRHNDSQIRDLRKEIINVKTSVDQELFDPKPDDYKCRWCDYKPLCPAWTNGSPSALLRKPAQSNGSNAFTNQTTSTAVKLDNLIEQTESLLKNLRNLKNDLPRG